MYSSRTHVLHVNRIAGVPETLVAQAQIDRKAWALKEIPPGSGNPAAVLFNRIDDLLDWQRVSAKADIIHVHYATNGYYGWGSKPFVLHIHGSDIRADWKKPFLRGVITRSLTRAEAVLYSTPDLYKHIRSIRPDAKWMPNPLPHEFLVRPKTTAKNTQVFFSSRWDQTKGVEILIPLARILIESGLRVTGLDWGDHRNLARQAGVELLPLMDRSTFAEYLASAQVVVGQLKYPTLSMTDYQTLAVDTPLVCAANIENPPALTVSTGDQEGFPRDPNKIAREIQEILTGIHKQSTREWVLERHHPRRTVEFLEGVYSEII